MIYDRLATITMSFSCIMLLVYLPKLYILVDRIRQCSRFQFPSMTWGATMSEPSALLVNSHGLPYKSKKFDSWKYLRVPEST